MKLLFWLEYYLGFIAQVFLKKRYEFEKKNLNEIGAKSFFHENIKADLAIEFSSEGEFQRVKYLVLELLKKSNFKIELIFCSPSVEDEVIRVSKEYPDQIRYFRLSNVSRGSNFLHSWITAKNFILVSYDFFPQILLLKEKMNRMILLSPNLKKVSAYKKAALNCFYEFVCDTENDKKTILKIKPNANVIVGNFRSLEILKRQSDSLNKITSKIPWFEEFIKKKLEVKNKIILGNYWHDEFDSLPLEIKENNSTLVIVPHLLDADQNNEIVADFSNACIVTENSLPDYSKDVFIFSIKGILCELYTFFDIAYVGGGYRKSVHSILEPVLAGCYTFFGPKVEKSNEYDLCQRSFSNRVGFNFKDFENSAIDRSKMNLDAHEEFIASFL